jgi:hypothetical protein
MNFLALILAAAVGLVMTVIGGRGATLIENAICASSEDNLIFASNLIKEGDEKAVQVLFQKGLIRNLNGVEVTRMSEDKYGIAIIRVVGTVDFYYVSVANIVKSKTELAADAARVAQSEQDDENAELAREARFDKAAHAPPPPPSPYDILHAAYKAFFKADADLSAAQRADPEGVLDTTKQTKLDYDAAKAELSKAQDDYDSSQ